MEEIKVNNEIPQPSGPCQKCNQRPATAFWTGSEGAIGFVHGFYQQWCEVCCLEESLKYAREQAARIPELEDQLAKLLAKEQ